MSKHTVVSTAATLLCAGALTGLTPTSAQAGTAPVKCHLTYSMSGWSAIYQHAEGRGKVSCNNGQRATVTISVHGRPDRRQVPRERPRRHQQRLQHQGRVRQLRAGRRFGRRGEERYCPGADQGIYVDGVDRQR
jgi:hypothetical protein